MSPFASDGIVLSIEEKGTQLFFIDIRS